MALLVALDLDNIKAQVQRDQRLPAERYTLYALHAVITEIEEAAKNISESGIAQRIAAFSIPPVFRKSPNAVGGWTHAAQQLETLEEYRYISLLTTHSPNLADHTLTEVALRYLWDPYITACLLITEDGRHPFPRFVQDAYSRGKTVHLAGYKAIPPSLRGFRDAICILLADGVARKLESVTPTTPRTDTARSPSPLLESAREFTRSPQSTAIEPTHRVTLQKMIAAIEAAVAEEGKTRWGLAELTRAIEYHWTGRPPREEEVRTMLQSLLRSGKLFQEWQTFEYSPDLKFLQEARG